MASAKHNDAPSTAVQERLAAEAEKADERAALARRRARSAKLEWKKARKASKAAKKAAKLAHKAVAASKTETAAETATEAKPKGRPKRVPRPAAARKPRATGSMPAGEVARTVIKRLSAKPAPVAAEVLPGEPTVSSAAAHPTVDDRKS